MPDSLQADWVKIQILETLTDSMNFIKTLIAVAVSMVTDFKNMLPAESYSKHSYGDMKLKILKRKCEHNEAQFVSKTMNNAFRAFEEKYLRKLALCFYVNEYHKNKLIEFHVFEFKYYGEGITKDICSENRDSLTILKEDALEEVQERAMYFIKAWMAVAQMCQDTLPANYGMSVQLSYNDSAPEDYQAPGYCRGADHIASKYHEAVKLAGVKTPFHRLVARSYKLDVGCNRGTYIIAVAEWTKIFQHQSTETYTSSVTFMKQLTTVAVSTLTYLKNIFNEESYTVQSLGGVKLRILKQNCSDDFAQFVSTSLRQAFEAFDKKYVQELALCFYAGECHEDNLLECHVFEYSYCDDTVSMQMHSRNRALHNSHKFGFDKVRECTLNLIQSCMAVAKYCKTGEPDSIDISMRLYYNEDAPEGYQAPGFEPGAGGAEVGAGGCSLVPLGGVETRHHRLDVRSYVRDQRPPSSRDGNASDNPPVMTQDLMDDEPMDAAPAGLRCPCNNGSGDPGLLLTCEHCGTRQHAACFGVQSAAARRHCCERCADTDVTRQPTDTLLASLQRRPDMRESLCLFRRALWLCARRGEVGIDTLVVEFGLTSLAATKLMKALHSHDVFELRDKADALSPQKINMAQMHVAINKFFKSEESDLVERLVFESLSQEKPDLVGSALTPTERASLRAPASIVAVASPASCSPLDPTLHRYQEALAATSPPDEDLPLFYHSAQLPKSNKRKNNQSDIEKSGAKIPRRAWNSD